MASLARCRSRKPGAGCPAVPHRRRLGHIDPPPRGSSRPHSAFVALLFIPIAIGIPVLYHWSTSRPCRSRRYDAPPPRLDEHARVPDPRACYFAIWIGIGTLLERWSIRQDETGDPKLDIFAQRLSAPGLIAYAGTISFAAVDWIVSLSDHWYSTMIGFLLIVEQGLSAMAFLIIVMTVLSVREPIRDSFRGGISRTSASCC